MNDFTKDELKEMRRCVLYMIKGNTFPYSSLTIELNKKLQSLIDNYCEHEHNPYIGNNPDNKDWT